MKTTILLSMLFLHIVDDYYLQGLLGKLKQKSWWRENASEDLYRYDYIIALIEHAFSWSFMIHLPIIAYILHSGLPATFLWISVPINLIIHAVIDHIKANMLKINLTTDQILHIVQIIITFIIYFKIIA